MDDAAQLLDSLGSPTRRAIIDRLRAGERSVRELTDAVGLSQPSVSQHLKVLAGAGLVCSRTSGARHLYRIDPDGFTQLRAWVDRFWDDTLGEFASYVDQCTVETTENEQE